MNIDMTQWVAAWALWGLTASVVMAKKEGKIRLGAVIACILCGPLAFLVVVIDAIPFGKYIWISNAQKRKDKEADKAHIIEWDEMEVCPFCKLPPVMVNTKDTYQVGCRRMSCKVNPHTGEYNEPRDASDAWKKRKDR
jgi:hypothetical protein